MPPQKLQVSCYGIINNVRLQLPPFSPLRFSFLLLVSIAYSLLVIKFTAVTFELFLNYLYKRMIVYSLSWPSLPAVQITRRNSCETDHEPRNKNRLCPPFSQTLVFSPITFCMLKTHAWECVYLAPAQCLSLLLGTCGKTTHCPCV